MGKIKMENGRLSVPENPTILYIEGDGVGAEITKEMIRVVNAAVTKAYDSSRRIDWQEVLAGEKAVREVGTSLPEKTIKCIEDNMIALKGPLATPVGKGNRSLNVALRQQLDLYVCLRPVKYYSGTPSPIKHPEKVDMVVFRENTEDIYSGIEWRAESAESAKVISFLTNEMNVNKIRFPKTSAIGIKPISIEGSKRLVRAAIKYAIDNNRKSVTLVHKGNIMKFTEGGFREWGYQVAKEEFGAKSIGNKVVIEKDGNTIEIKDAICDAFLQNIILKSEDYDVVATMNLNGDYISDALAALVGGIGIAPGANINYESGRAIFEATHGTAPDIAGKNEANPLSLILSAEMMLTYIGWKEAAELIRNAVSSAINTKCVTKDFYSILKKERDRKAKLLSLSEFSDLLCSFI